MTTRASSGCTRRSGQPAVLQVVAVHAGDDHVLELDAAMVTSDLTGSSASSGSGRPWPTSQKGQRRVHLSPMIMKVGRAPCQAFTDVGAGLLRTPCGTFAPQDLLDLVKRVVRRPGLDADPTPASSAPRPAMTFDQDARVWFAPFVFPDGSWGVAGHGRADVREKAGRAGAPSSTSRPRPRSRREGPDYRGRWFRAPPPTRRLMRWKGARSTFTLSARPWKLQCRLT